MNDNPFAPSPRSMRAPELVRYEFRGATVDAPPEWGEDSALALVPNLKAAITLRRVSTEKDTTLEFFVSKRIAELAQTVANLQVEEMRDSVLGGARAKRMKLSWAEETGPFGEQLVIALFDEAAFVLAMTGVPSDLEPMEAAFDRVAASFRFPGLR